ncbi:putative F-box protein [Coleophoma crateriformis]|uniref:Putative F-box protein n=1 Tax=Coleophoma crateriformis TaxID=565419 RepID=A0A3D8RDF9_9HELO|nr:putative F-box protein [Coleophoma crateriformis]
MEPLHITEFASERYFSKLRQLNSHDSTENASTSTAPPASHPQPQAPQSTTFTLPIGQPRHTSHDALPLRPSDQKKRSLGHDLTSLRTQRRPSFSGSFGSLRSRVTIIPKRPSVEIPEEAQPSVASVCTSRTLSELFLSLPHELQEQIITALPISTVLSLRLTSRAFHRLVTLNESSIARYHIANTLPAYALRLYPVPEADEVNLHYICGLWHRMHVALKLSHMITEQTTKEIFLRTTEAQRLEFEPQHKRMRQRLMPLVFAIFHFFETYRNLHTEYLANHGIPLSLLPYTRNPIECQVMDMYDDQTLLKVHQVFPLVISSFSRRLRPPSYAGRLERSIKGYLKDRPADEVYAAILSVGGLRQAQRFWETKGYNARRAAVDTWYGFVARAPVEPAPKSKMSLISHLGRKKNSPAIEAASAEVVAGHDAKSCNEWYCVKPSCVASRKQPQKDDLIFRTSLSAGPPMSPLTPDQLRVVTSDLPSLTSMWLQTAEALILERGIVEGPQNIKRNTQVLLELIRDDGNALDEDWTPGVTLARSRSRTVNIDHQEGMGRPGGISD